MHSIQVLLFSCLFTIAIACPKKFIPRPTVKVGIVQTLDDKGTITLTEKDGKLEFKFDLKGLTNGKLGVAVMKSGDCGAGITLGDHYNPSKKKHGAPGSKEHHLGDLGTIEVKDGKSTNTITTKMDLNGRDSILGRAVMVFTNEDTGKEDVDLGAKKACGVIAVKEEK